MVKAWSWTSDTQGTGWGGAKPRKMWESREKAELKTASRAGPRAAALPDRQPSLGPVCRGGGRGGSMKGVPQYRMPTGHTTTSLVWISGQPLHPPPKLQAGLLSCRGHGLEPLGKGVASLSPILGVSAGPALPSETCDIFTGSQAGEVSGNRTWIIDNSLSSWPRLLGRAETQGSPKAIYGH